MRLFKRGARPATPVAKNVSVTELLMRSDTGQAAAGSVAANGSPVQSNQVPGPNATAKSQTEARNA